MPNQEDKQPITFYIQLCLLFSKLGRWSSPSILLKWSESVNKSMTLQSLWLNVFSPCFNNLVWMLLAPTCLCWLMSTGTSSSKCGIFTHGLLAKTWQFIRHSSVPHWTWYTFPISSYLHYWLIEGLFLFLRLAFSPPTATLVACFHVIRKPVYCTTTMMWWELWVPLLPASSPCLHGS